MSELTPEQKIERGRRAQALLDDPLLHECVEEQKRTYYQEWIRTSPEDQAARERLYLAAQLADQVYVHLRTLIGGGKLAAQTLEKLKGRVR